MNKFLIVSVGGGGQHIVTDAISKSGEQQGIYFAGSFADCWAWIQYQEYNVLGAQSSAGKRK